MINNNYQSKTAIITRDFNISYHELGCNINQYSQFISNPEVKKVAIFSENRVEWIYAFYAAWENGCIAVPIDFMASVDDVAYIINDCRPELIFASSGTKDSIEKVKAKLSYHPEVKIFEELELPALVDAALWAGPGGGVRLRWFVGW